MLSQHLTRVFLATTTVALLFPVSAAAQNNRSFVATTGNDANNCSAAAFCRTFTAALAVTNPGGEIVVVNSGGYGPATINQPVTINAIGIDASITQTASGQVAINITTTGNVTLNGLNLNGGGTGQAGIDAGNVGFLRLYNMQIQNFTGPCVFFGSSGNMAMYDSKASDCLNGVVVNAAGSRVYVNNTAFDHNSTSGAIAFAGELTVADSSAHSNGAGFTAAGGNVALYNDRATFNGTGLAASAGRLDFANCLISFNEGSFAITGTGTMGETNPGTSLITSGQGSNGSLSTANVLQ